MPSVAAGPNRIGGFMASLTDDAIARIREMIVTGDLQPGQRLPPEKQLSEELGLSRNSLREAVKALELIRVLDVRRGDGTYVTSLEPRLLLEAMNFVVDLHTDQSFLEIFAVRRILEPAATGMAAARLTDEQLARLESLLADAQATGPIEALVDHDLAFHQAIVEGAGNEYLTRLVEAMQSGTQRARVWRGLTQHHAAERTIAEHRAILDALHEHDAELASALALSHIAGIERWLREASL